MQFKKNNKKRGYTIIETMISVSLFIIIVMAGMGALLNANLLHQKSQNMRSIMDNLSFIMEDMSRNLRTGHDYYCMTSNTFPTPIIPDSGDRCDGVAFLSASGGSQLAYRIGSNSIEKYEGYHCFPKKLLLIQLPRGLQFWVLKVLQWGIFSNLLLSLDWSEK
jgi:Tfp pilus assembly protein PilW